MNGTNLKRLREDAALTRVDFAKRIGSEYGHLWRLEENKRDCLSETLRTIADVLAKELDRPVGEVLTELTEPK